MLFVDKVFVFYPSGVADGYVSFGQPVHTSVSPEMSKLLDGLS